MSNPGTSRGNGDFRYRFAHRRGREDNRREGARVTPSTSGARNRSRSRDSLKNRIGHRQQENGDKRTVRQMGFRFLQELLKNDDLEQVMFSLNNDKKGYKELLESREISSDMIVMLVKLQSRICDCTFPELKLALFELALRSCFIDSIIKFVSTVALQNEREKKHNALFWTDSEAFWKNLSKICEHYHDLIPATSCEAVLKLLKAARLNVPAIANNHPNVKVSEEVKAELERLFELVEATTVEVEKKLEVEKVQRETGALEPPDDFREISVYPGPVEVTTMETPFLRPNVTKGPYRSVEHYLDVQFRLLREDFVAPLRKGICKYRKNPHERFENIKIYKNIKFLQQEAVTEQNCYRIQFDFSKTKRTYVYENSRRFMYGALLCFTHDNFKTLLFGKVVKRDVKDCLELGQLVVGFTADVGLPANLFKISYLMVESTVFFEPYYQVLNVLKNMRAASFPMERYIIRVEKDTAPPKYLLQIDPQFYTIGNEKFFPLDWGQRRFHGLNDSQSAAFQAALTRQFAIIQGPPGTGKTFLGLRVARTLLMNKHVWYRNTPLLVICYTNHALDQFLEGLIPATPKIVRVGGQSKNEKLNEFNIRNKRRHYPNDAVRQRRHDVRDLVQKISTIDSHLKMIEANVCVIRFGVFAEVVPGFRDSWFGSARHDQIYGWLMSGWEQKEQNRRRNRGGKKGKNQEKEAASVNIEETKDEEPEKETQKEDEPILEEETMDIDNDVVIDDIFDDIIVVNELHELVDVRSFRVKLNTLRENWAELNRMQPRNEWENDWKMRMADQLNFEFYRTQNELEYLTFQLDEGKKNIARSQPQFVDLVNPHRMAHDDRWRLYYHWLSLYVERLKVKKEDIGKQFRRTYALYNDMMSMEDAQVMKESLVVGMTTTGAARLQSSLQTLKCPIVIVEEAAEILEAHIISALTSHCKHLILIGDHQQLKPSAADFKVETKYLLGVSLFERMVVNDIQCHTLDVQHRMRPEISSLVRPAVYPVLHDHESTMRRPRIAGVDKCLFFLDHRKEEQLCKDNSKKNVHEAQFLIMFARHLILNGYKPENITILAAYLGQMFEMQREKSKYRMQLRDVRIAVLDNYQGEESDIILLSLVRNNHEDRIGFLKTENRVCVALSRARNGFYIMGNMELLCNNSEIWPKVNETLKNQDAIGTELALRCQVHPEKVTLVRTAEDFSKFPEGGCELMCDAKLNCGHVCKRLCHVEDREHRLYKCNENCERLPCDRADHPCLKRCSADCGRCTYLVERTLPLCGHVVSIECHVDPALYRCAVPVPAALPCGHDATKPCGEDVAAARCPRPCDVRVEPCGHACAKKCHVGKDPDHLQYQCMKPCAKPLKGCTMKEGEGHVCRKLCHEECSLCEVTVKKTRSKCRHIFQVPCHVDVDEVYCVKPCKKELECGHKCSDNCGDPCGDCKVIVEKEVPDCKHTVKIQCFQEADRKFCKNRCPRLLSCGHACKEKCFEECTQDCRAEVDCSIESPCGHTIKKIWCSKKDTAEAGLLLRLCTERCPVQLECEHACQGTCGACAQGRAHARCAEKCGVPLVCGHECPIPCREACKPCLERCPYRCTHSKCGKKCGEPCTRCKEPCPRRCNHQKCSMQCWQYCDVPPCEHPCPKRLPCGHPCVGYCGDPCPPLCRHCHREQLTEVFLGHEDEEDAVYVVLVDCQHVFEAGDMLQWLGTDEDQIKPKVCPKCKTTIMKTDRYSDYCKQSIEDLIKVKYRFYGDPREIANTIERLRADAVHLLRKCSRLDAFSDLGSFLKTLTRRLEPMQFKQKGKHKFNHDIRRQNVNKTDLQAIDSKIKLVGIMVGAIEKLSPQRENALRRNISIASRRLEAIVTPKPLSAEQLKFVLALLSRDESSITEQEVNDVTLEIDRFVRINQFEEIISVRNAVHSSSKVAVDEKVAAVKKLLENPTRYDKQQDDVLKSELEILKKITASAIQITNAERAEIVKAVGLTKGHWYKCPNGHPYAIGDCGGANQVSTCYECGVPIGGSNHRLLPGQQVATEMDGATHSAWSEQMNMQNYVL